MWVPRRGPLSLPCVSLLLCVFVQSPCALPLGAGREGYLAKARQYAEATAAITSALRALPGIRLLGAPDAAIVAFTSDVFGVFYARVRALCRRRSSWAGGLRTMWLG